MNKIFFTITFLIFGLSAHAQMANFEWVNTFQGKTMSTVSGMGVVTDSKGNLYSVGKFKGEVNFEGHKGKYNLTSTSDTDKFGNIDVWDLYLTKHNKSGKLIWAKSLLPLNMEWATSILLDHEDNLYIADGGIIVKLDTNANKLWSKPIASWSLELSIDNKNNIIATGKLGGKTDLDPGTDSFIVDTSGVFILKLNPQGSFIWAKVFTGDAYSHSISTDSLGNIYSSGVVGYVKTDFNPGQDTFYLSSTKAQFMVYISKLDSSGNFVWAKKVGGQYDMHYTNTTIVNDRAGNTFITGYFESTRDFDPGPGVYNLVGLPYDNPFSATRFLLKLNPLGQFSWAKIIGGGHSYGYDMDIDLSGNTYITGRFGGIVDFDPNAGISNLASTKGFEKIINDYYYSSDVFVLKMDAAGNFVWAKKIGGPDADGQIAICLDLKGSVYTMGYFSDTFSWNWKNRDSIDFNPGGPDGKILGCGIFIYKMSQASCSNMALQIDSIRNVSCSYGPGYIWAKAVNGKAPYSYLWNTSPPIKTPQAKINMRGIYTLTATDTNGCSRTSTIIMKGPLYTIAWDIGINLIATRLRPGRTATIILNGVNEGCIPLNGELKLVLDSLVTFKKSTPPPNKIIGNTLIWNYKYLTADSFALAPQIEVVPLTTNTSGDSVRFSVSVSPFADSNPSNNIKTYTFPIINSYDPNIKTVYPAGECKKKYVLKNRPLTYTIQFQNTGTAEAIDIFILDTLDYNLKPNSLRVVSYSHPHLIAEILNNNIVRFRFDNINLPDSTSNEKASHGYVVYEIWADSMVNNETTITGKAGIYFDFNKPVFTNSVINTLTNKIYTCPPKVGISKLQLTGKILAYPNPGSGKYSIQMTESDIIKVYDILGNIIYTSHFSPGINTIDISNQPAGIYILETSEIKFRLIKTN